MPWKSGEFIPEPCAVRGCSGFTRPTGCAFGLCWNHYREKLLRGRIDPTRGHGQPCDPQRRATVDCPWAGCKTKTSPASVARHGVGCSAHRKGLAQGRREPKPPLAFQAWLRRRIERVPGGCWRWRGAVDSAGRPNACLPGTKGKKAIPVTSGLFDLFRPGQREPDQKTYRTCENRSCVNPEHRTVTYADSVWDGPRGPRKLKTHCVHGHRYSDANTYRLPGKPRTRICRECHRIARRKWKASVRTRRRRGA